MADPQDPSDGTPEGAAKPPAKKAPAKAVKKTAKAPSDKAPAKKAPAKKAAKSPAKKAPAKKAEAKQAPAKSPENAPEKAVPPKAAEPLSPQQRVETNGHQLDAAKDAAAQAKSTVDDANSPVPGAPRLPAESGSRLPLVVAITLSLLAALLIRQLRRR